MSQSIDVLNFSNRSNRNNINQDRNTLHIEKKYIKKPIARIGICKCRSQVGNANRSAVSTWLVEAIKYRYIKLMQWGELMTCPQIAIQVFRVYNKRSIWPHNPVWSPLTKRVVHTSVVRSNFSVVL